MSTSNVKFPYNILSEFPSLEGWRRSVFCDGAEVLRYTVAFSRMTKQMERGAANIGGYYDTSRKCLDTTKEARQAAADWFNCDSEEAFGNNMRRWPHVAHSIANDTFEEGDNVVLSALDHDANVGPWCRVAEDRGVEVRFIPLFRRRASWTRVDLKKWWIRELESSQSDTPRMRWNRERREACM